MHLVFGILAIAGVMFASNRIRLDVVALLTVLALMLTGVLTSGEALAGFGDPVVLLVASLLVVGEALTRTGVAYEVGRWIMRHAGSNETRVLVLLMGSAALLGSAMSSTAVVAIFIPVALAISERTDLNASRLLMPLSSAALISGMLTLIATTPNLVVSAELHHNGYEPFAFFSFLPIGLAVLVVGMLYMLTAGRLLLPGDRVSKPKGAARTMADLSTGFDLDERRHRLRVTAASALVGQTLAESGLGQRGLRVVGVERAQRLRTVRIPTPNPAIELHEGDVLAVDGKSEVASRISGEEGLEVLSVSDADLEKWRQEYGVAVVLIHPESSLIGQSLRGGEFRSRFGVHVLGLRRGGNAIEDYVDVPLGASDSLLVQGPWHRIAMLQADSHDFVVLALPVEMDEVAPARSKAPIALAIVLGMVLLSAFEIVPVVAAVLMAALAVIFVGCLTMEDAYRSIHWSSIVLIAGMLPVADALEKTGGVDIIVALLSESVGGSGPYVMMGVLFLITSALGLVMSNTATAVIMAPVAIKAALLLSVSPRPFAMVVAIAASAAFATPVSTPVVTLVVEPGSYRFSDFVKVGVPLVLLTGATTLFVVPLVFPF